LKNRFDDKVMAIVGFEADQVRKTPQGDVGVPINMAYNHHYGATLTGKGSSMQRIRVTETADHRAMHPGPEPGFATVPVEHTPSLSGQPTSMVFGYSNGGEYRKTYHGLVPPFAQLVDSPTTVHITPMQIDTWNRAEMNLTGGSKFVPGPAPTNSYAPTSGVDAIYSGLLECPLTTRIRKQITGGGWNASFAVQLDTCDHTIETATDCFAAAAEIGLDGAPHTTVTTGQGSSASLPAGCSVQITTTTTTTTKEEEGGSAVAAHLYFNTNNDSYVGCGAGAVDAIAGHEPSQVGVNLTLSLSPALDSVNITITGPPAVWFGIGFDTQFMDNSPYAVIVDGTGGVTERVLGNHAPGIQLNTSVTVLSHTVEGGVRSVVLTRPLKGLTPHHHDFDARKMSLNFIAAVGSGSDFAYHKAKTTATMALWPMSTADDPTTKGGDFGFFAGAPATAGLFRDNYDGEVGYEFKTTKRPLTVTALGRSGIALKAGARVTIWEATTGKAVASAVVGAADTRTYVDADAGVDTEMGTGTGTGGYSYVNLTTSVVLKGDASYRVTLSCSTGMPDKWIDTDANAKEAIWMLGAVGNGVFSSKAGEFPTSTSTHGRWAGIATFKVAVPPHSTPASGGGSKPATCVCAIPAAPFGQGMGTLKYLPTGEVIGFPFRCNLGDADFSVMKNRNPTCDIRTYLGGLSTCHHGWHMLDADQDVPWMDQPISYYMKYRLYYQEFQGASSTTTTTSNDEDTEGGNSTIVTTTTPASHINAFDLTWSIAGATGEYDVPRCPEGTPTNECFHEISGSIVPPGTDFHFVAAHYHCHAPTCISLEIWNNRTGELLCKETPYHGAASAATQADRFDEPGYIAQRICLWGMHPPFEFPPLVSGETLWVKAVTNNTYGHHGEMALPQMLLASIPKTE
jgi:hypothetical protein